MGRVWMMGALVVGLSVAAPAWAQSEGQDDATAIGREAVEQGAKLYLEGKYAEAIVMWQRAYAVWGAATIRYNQALAAAKLGNYRQALTYGAQAEGENELALPENLAVKNQANLRAWKVIVDVRSSADAIAESRRAVQALNMGSGPFVPGWRTWTGAGLVTAAAGVGVGALVMSSDASAQNEELAAAQTPNDYGVQRAELEDTQSLGQTLLVSSVALGLVGGGLALWDYLDHVSSPAVLVEPREGGGSVGLMWRLP